MNDGPETMRARGSEIEKFSSSFFCANKKKANEKRKVNGFED
jgi:hypothetical protein